jgi:hypothetical protein
VLSVNSKQMILKKETKFEVLYITTGDASRCLSGILFKADVILIFYYIFGIKGFVVVVVVVVY